MQNAFQSTRDRVQNSASSIFTKADVLALLSEVEATAAVLAPEKIDFNAIIDRAIATVACAVADHNFYDNCDVSLDGREIIVDFDTAALTDELESALEDMRNHLADADKN